MKKLMILGASILQLPAIENAKKLGYHVIALDADPNAIGFKFADESLLISTIETEKIIIAAIEKKIDGIMTLATDMPVRSVAAVAKELNLTGISYETAICATDKYRMRERLAISKVPIPAFYRANSIDEYYRITDLFNDPFIVKPVDNSGSRGIYLVRSKNELETAFFHAKKDSRSGEIIIEEFMTGREVSVETLSINGQVNVLAVTDKLNTGAPFFVEMGHSQPAQFDIITLEKIKEVAAEAILALGIENGPSHTEIMVTENGPKIVEVGARLGGGCITTHLVPLSTGINMVECCIKIAMNEKPDFDIKFNKASSIRFFRTSAGQIQSISGIDKALLIRGICEVTFVKNEGDVINNIQCGSDRVGFVIAQSENVKEAIDTCEKAMNIIKISVAPIIK